jgi:NAD(P)H dehydrogenase (quinone)
MKTLIITAHPSQNAFTHRIAALLKEQREKEGESVEIFDLYKTELKQDFLCFESRQELKCENAFRTEIQNKLKEADEYIFIHPLWWLNMPAIMKNFLDHNITAGFAFHYENGKRIPHLTDKTARLYITCDGPKAVYYLLGLPFIKIWYFGIFVFCGIKLQNFTILRMLNKTEEQRNTMLTNVKKQANRSSILLRLANFVTSKIKL